MALLAPSEAAKLELSYKFTRGFPGRRDGKSEAQRGPAVAQGHTAIRLA